MNGSTILMAAGLLLNSLWQGVLIAAVVQAAARMLPDGLAAYRYALRWLGLVLLVVIALVPVIRERAAPARHATDAATATAPARNHLVPSRPVAVLMETSPISSTMPVWPLAVLLMVCCAGVLLGRLVLSYVALERTKRQAKRVDAGAAVESALRQFTLAESDEVETPVLAGLWRPAVLLPVGFMDRYPAAEVQAAILHEQAHLARWDDWTQLAQRLLDAALFFHPGVRGLTWGMELDRELACDVMVLARTGDPRSYCQCLARLVGVAVPSAAPMLLTGRGRTIFKRMETIMNLREIHGRRRALAALAAVAVIGAMLAAIGPMVVLQGTAPSLRAQEVSEQAKPRAVTPRVARPVTRQNQAQEPPLQRGPVQRGESATPSLDQAMRDLNRDMASVEQAIKASMREAEVAMRNLGPALKAVDESLRSLESNIEIQSLGGLTAEQYRAAEAQNAQAAVLRAEAVALEIATDPESYRKRVAEYIELLGKDFGLPRAQIDAALQVLANRGTVTEALRALTPAN